MGSDPAALLVPGSCDSGSYGANHQQHRGGSADSRALGEPQGAPARSEGSSAIQKAVVKWSQGQWVGMMMAATKGVDSSGGGSSINKTNSNENNAYDKDEICRVTRRDVRTLEG